MDAVQRLANDASTSARMGRSIRQDRDALRAFIAAHAGRRVECVAWNDKPGGDGRWHAGELPNGYVTGMDDRRATLILHDEEKS